MKIGFPWDHFKCQEIARMQDFAPFTPELLRAARPPAVKPPLRGVCVGGGGGGGGGYLTRLLNRFEYTSFWGSYGPDIFNVI